MSPIPGLREDSDRMLASAMSPNTLDSEEAETFRMQLILVLSRLFLWRWDWEAEFPDVSYEVAIDPTKHITLDDDGVSACLGTSPCNQNPGANT